MSPTSTDKNQSPFNDPGTMTSEQRVVNALDYKPVDRVPFENGMFFSRDFIQRWAKEKNHPDAHIADLNDYYGNDIAEIGASQVPWPSMIKTIEDTDEYYISMTGFGETRKEIPSTNFWESLAFVLDDKTQLDKIPFESPDLESRYTGCLKSLKHLRDNYDYWIRIKVGGPYSRSKWMRGEEKFMMDMIEDQVFVKELINRITDLTIAVGVNSLRKAKLEHTAIHIHDDFASLRSMFFSRDMFEEFLAEPYKRMCDAFHKEGVRVYYGGEGNILEVIDILLDAGIAGFICSEHRAGVDMVKIREKYGKNVRYFGNICNTVILPSGDRQRIRDHVAEQMAVAKEGGCVVGASHLIGADVSVQSFDWMMEAIREMG